LAWKCIKSFITCALFSSSSKNSNLKLFWLESSSHILITCCPSFHVTHKPKSKFVLTWKFIKNSLIVLLPSPKLCTNTILNGVWRFESLNANLILTFKIETLCASQLFEMRVAKVHFAIWMFHKVHSCTVLATREISKTPHIPQTFLITNIVQKTFQGGY